MFLNGLVDDNVDRPPFPVAVFFKTGAAAVRLILSGHAGHASVIQYASEAQLRPKPKAKAFRSQLACRLYMMRPQLQNTSVARMGAALPKTGLRLHEVTSETDGRGASYAPTTSRGFAVRSALLRRPCRLAGQQGLVCN